MGQKTDIEWSDSTANPMIGCDGCELWIPEKGVKICYAGNLVERYGGHNVGFPKSFESPELFPHRFAEALRWSDLTGKARPEKPWLDGLPRIIFWCDLGDPFTAKLPDDWLDPYLEDLAASPHQHLWLTKRPNRAAAYSKRIGGFPKNFWVGASMTEQAYRHRLDQLSEVRAGLLFCSFEPCKEVIDFSPYADWLRWVIVGGVSGQNAAPTDVRIIGQTVLQCFDLDIAVLVKQVGSHPFETPPCLGGWPDGFIIDAEGLAWPRVDSKGGDWGRWPEPLRVREMPIQPLVQQATLFA